MFRIFPRRFRNRDDEMISLLNVISVQLGSIHEATLNMRNADSQQKKWLGEAVDKMEDMVDLARNKPFTALKTWIDDQIEDRYKRNDQHEKMQAELLARWDRHVKAVESERDTLRRQVDQLRYPEMEVLPDHIESKPVSFVIVRDPDLRECLYIDGVAWKFTDEDSVNAEDLANESKGEPFTVEVKEIKWGFDSWPLKIEVALDQDEASA